jgi:hypothetical protein
MLGAMVILVTACPLSTGALPNDKSCDGASLLARYQANFSTPMVLPDRLDAKIERTTPYEVDVDVARPAGFKRGYVADVYLAVVIDTSGHVALAQVANEDVRATTATQPPTPETRAGFAQAALDQVSPLAFTKPRLHGQPVLAVVCMPFRFRER